MTFRELRLYLAAAVVPAAGLFTACGGPPVPDTRPVPRSIFADMDRTAEWVNAQNYRYCNINDDRVCLSPDSLIEFQFPKEINDTALDDEIQADLIIWNEGLDTVRLVEYSITAVDDSNQTYEAILQEPEELHDPGMELPGLTLQADERIRLPFTVSLDDAYRQITRLTFRYQTGEMAEPTEIAISYRASSIRYIEDQP